VVAHRRQVVVAHNQLEPAVALEGSAQVLVQLADL
jgi:hypothetical protein